MDDPTPLDEECFALEAILEEKFARLDKDHVRIIVEPLDHDASSQNVPLYLELQLPEGYPDSVPMFDLSNTNNAAFLHEVKAEILRGLQDQAQQQLGECMMYSLVGWVQEHLPEFVQKSLSAKTAKKATAGPDQAAGHPADPGKDVADHSYKEMTKDMTKAQKRRYIDRFGLSDERARGWDWVDVISHLSKY